MKVLFLINSGRMGGLERHVHCIAKSLPVEVMCRVCCVIPGEATEAMVHDGIDVVSLCGSSGHDFRIIVPFIRLLRSYRPDVAHVHSSSLLLMVVLRFFPRIRVVRSIHTTTHARRSFKQRVSDALERTPDYFLPVSGATWKAFLNVYPMANGEVFFNVLRLNELPKKITPNTANRIIGMVGRMADQKDWISFLKICARVLATQTNVEAWAIGDGPERSDYEDAWNKIAIDHNVEIGRMKWFGSRQDANRMIGQMNVFVFTSYHEQLPTTLLEAFAMRTPVVGFLPEGGTAEVLALSDVPCACLHLKRDCETVANDVLRILNDDQARDTMINAAGRVIAQHFDAEKMCRGQLLDIYRRVVK